MKNLFINIKDIFRKIHFLSSSFWFSEVKSKAFLLLFLLITFTSLFIWVDVENTKIYGEWMEKLQAKEKESYYQLLYLLFGSFFLMISLSTISYMIQEYLGLFWREWMSKNFLSTYLLNQSFYSLQQNRTIDNPDQRITDDIRSFVEKTLDIFIDFFRSFFTALSYFFMLWNISKNLFYSTLGISFFITVISIFVFGRRLSRLNIDQYKKEADFRYNLMRIREHSESIAFFSGEQREYTTVTSYLREVIANKIKILLTSSALRYFQSIVSFLVLALPYIVVAENYFSGEVNFGTISQSSIAFGSILSALLLIASKLETLTVYFADLSRLSELQEAMQSEKTKDTQIQIKNTSNLEIHNLHLYTYDGETELISNLSMQLENSDPLLITGPSGVGKSSLLRAIAGLWTRGSGEIYIPNRKDLFFFPQKPYLPIGSLKDILTYPNDSMNISLSEIQIILQEVGLENLEKRIGSFERELDFSHILSLGEQQRIAFGRLLVSQKKIAILDESTSALDSENEMKMYALLEKKQIQFISVAHRESIRKFHKIELHLENKNNWQLKKIES